MCRPSLGLLPALIYLSLVLEASKHNIWFLKSGLGLKLYPEKSVYLTRKRTVSWYKDDPTLIPKDFNPLNYSVCLSALLSDKLKLHTKHQRDNFTSRHSDQAESQGQIYITRYIYFTLRLKQYKTAWCIYWTKTVSFQGF